MLSLILYGRNDNYGYNLHKRAALSLNCMAEVLDDEDDEILFVDYNTPDDFPTFVEAIQDTLSDKARSRLRIFRIRPQIHNRLRDRTRLLAIEPISRNVAVRRSNPSNRWILSTNTDIIFVALSRRSLSDIVGQLPKGVYGAPRIEVPETLWESLDRLNPIHAIEQVRDWGSSLHLNELVKVSADVLYDGPGDFQLIERQDLFRYQAFDEEMILGWHVDANIFKRMGLVYGHISDLGTEVYGYHCDHTRQITPAHSHTRSQNDARRFVDEVMGPEIPRQADTWGCPDEDIEEISLRTDRSGAYVKALREVIGKPQSTPLEAEYTSATYNGVDYDPRHLLPFLVDLFISAERHIDIAWSGARRETLGMFCKMWHKLGFAGRILVEKDQVGAGIFAATPETTLVDLATLLDQASAFVFDYGTPSVSPGPKILAPDLRDAMNRTLISVICAEQERFVEGRQSRRVVAINAVNNEYEAAFCRHIAAAATPFACRLRHGFVMPPPVGPQELTDDLQVGEAAAERPGKIISRADQLGLVARGPCVGFLPGRYRLEFSLVTTPNPTLEPVVHLNCFYGRMYLGHLCVTQKEIEGGTQALEIDIDHEVASQFGSTLEVAIGKLAPVGLTVEKVTLERVGASTGTIATRSRILNLPNWLPLLSVGSGGLRSSGEVVGIAGAAGPLVYGPYCRLGEGTFEASFSLSVASPELLDPSEPLCTLEVCVRDLRLGARTVRRVDLDEGLQKVQFGVTREQSNDPKFLIETRVIGRTKRPLTVRGLRVSRIGEATGRNELKEIELLPFLYVGSAGQWQDGIVVSRQGEHGHVVFGPYWALLGGNYEAVFQISAGWGSHEDGLNPRSECGPTNLVLEICVRGDVVASKAMHQLRTFEPVPVPFVLTREDGPVEARVWTSGAMSIQVQSVVLRKQRFEPHTEPRVRSSR